jgi:hypothetical protein
MAKKDINPINDPNDRDKNGTTGPCIEKTLEVRDTGEMNSYQFVQRSAEILLVSHQFINRHLPARSWPDHCFSEQGDAVVLTFPMIVE